MKQLYKIISVILIIIMIDTSMPSDLFALRPASHRLTGLLDSSPILPDNHSILLKKYTIFTTPDESSRKFISEDTAMIKLEFSPLAIEEIEVFLQKNSITIYNLHSIPHEKLSLLVHLMKKLPTAHITGLKIRFARSVLLKNIRGFYLSPVDTIFLPKGLHMAALPSVFLREIGRRVGERIDEKIKQDLYKTRWIMIPFLGTVILFPIVAVICTHLITLMNASFSKFQMGLAYLTFAILVTWSFGRLFLSDLTKDFGAKTGLFFNKFNLYIRVNNSKNKITDLSGVTPSKYFADAYSAYVLLNRELRKAAENDDQVKETYEILEKRIFKQRHRHSTRERSKTLLDNVILTTAGDTDGKHAFTIALSAYDRENMQIFLKGQEQPDVVFLTLNPLINNSALEGLFFQRMFFDPIVKGYSARYTKLLEDLAALDKESPDYRHKIDEMDAFKHEVIDSGYHIDILAKGLISGKLTVIVNSKEDKSRVLKMVKSFFTGHNANFYEAKLVDSGYSQRTAKMLSQEFARNRALHFAGGLFNREGKTSLESDEAFDSLIDEIIDIQALVSGSSITLHKGMPTLPAPANSIKIERKGDDYLITEEGGQKYYINKECLNLEADGQFYSSWTRREVGMFKEVISLSAQDEGELIIMPLGNADPTPFSGKQDYTNLLLAFNGRGILVDPSAQALRNMRANEFLNIVDAFYLSHVHWDHFGGMIDFVYRQLSAQDNGAQIGSMPLIAAVAVYETAFDYLNALTNISRYDFEKIFPLVKTKKELDIEAVLFDEELPRFAQMEMLLNRTFGHTLPTYGFQILTKKGTFAYLPDSLMPSKESPLRREFIKFYRDNVSLLISENGVPGMHITPEESIEVLKELVDIGAAYTVHSANRQNMPGLQRAQIFEPLKVIKRIDRSKNIEKVNRLLEALNAVEITDESIILGDFVRKQLATIGRIENMRKGHIIYREGDLVSDNPYLYIILSGSVDVEGIAGVANNVKTLGRGHVIGEMAILRRALNIYTKNDLKILFKNDLIYQQFIAEIGYYVWKITSLTQLESLHLDDDIKSRMITLFNDSKQLPRSKTVVASKESSLLRIHMDEFIKLINAELKEADNASPLASSLEAIMKFRHDQDERINNFLAPIRSEGKVSIIPAAGKSSSSGRIEKMDGIDDLEELFNDDHHEMLDLLDQIGRKHSILELTRISKRIYKLSAEIGLSHMFTKKLLPSIKLYSDNVAACDVLINLAKSLVNLAPADQSLPVLLKLLINTETLMIRRSLTDIIINVSKQNKETADREVIVAAIFNMLKIGYPYTWKNALIFLTNNRIREAVTDLEFILSNVEDKEKRILIKKAVSILSKKEPKRSTGSLEIFSEFCKDICNSTNAENLRIIDLGANAGDFTRNAKDFDWGLKADIVSIDFKHDAPDMSIHLNLVEVERMDWSNLRFDNNEFDLITFNFPSPNAGLQRIGHALKEGARVCKEGGGVSFLSCTSEEDGYNIDDIVNILKKVGFSSDIRVINLSEEDIDYPLTGTSRQINKNIQYLITARKPQKKLSLDLSISNRQGLSVKADEATRDYGNLDILPDDHLLRIGVLTHNLIGSKMLVEKVVNKYIKDRNIRVSMCATCGLVFKVQKCEGPSSISHGICSKHSMVHKKIPGFVPLDKFLNFVAEQEIQEVALEDRAARYLEMHPEISRDIKMRSQRLSAPYIKKAIQSAA